LYLVCHLKVNQVQKSLLNQLKHPNVLIHKLIKKKQLLLLILHLWSTIFPMTIKNHQFFYPVIIYLFCKGLQNSIKQHSFPNMYMLYSNLLGKIYLPKKFMQLYYML
jgi:hypothetical protein